MDKPILNLVNRDKIKGIIFNLFYILIIFAPPKLSPGGGNGRRAWLRAMSS